MESSNLFPDRRDISVVDQNVVGRRKPLGASDLRREYFSRCRSINSIARDEALNLNFLWAVDHEYPVVVSSTSAFDIKGNRMNLVRPLRRGGALAEFLAYRGPGNRLEFFAFRGISKDSFANGAAIESPVRVERVRAELFDYALKRSCSGFHDVAGELVEIDDRHAESDEFIRHRRLAAGDSTGQGHNKRHQPIPH